ncbi:hypothetical protein FJZ55_08530, partial [Candidatus Woesearchaeota archaeon]|nr:hypothetical protein [Candidatus Woesearchaeota archaeon]
MEDFARNLILAGEISGFLHDLGKLHPGFAKENLKGGVNLSDQSKKQTKIGAAHGAILEDGRIYPSAEELAQNLNLQDCLEQLLKHEGWAGCLNVPEAWLKTATAQVTGLGAPLRQHHAGHDWPDAEASLLGDLYAMGADIRDSALDKASSGAQKCKQHLNQAVIADTFGQVQQCYSPETLKDLWQQIPDRLAVLWEKGACDQVGYTRNKLFSRLDGLFLKALGETRRPTNDVTLWHHSFSTASHFKAALAEGVLRKDFSPWQNVEDSENPRKKKGIFDRDKIGQVRFRLLGIRWNWRELTRQAFRPVTLVSLTERRDELIAAIRQKVEVEYPIGNIIYQDDDGVLILAPGFYEADANESENRFAKHILNPLQNALTGAVEKFFGSG